MKKSTLKKLIAAIILAIFVVATFLLYNYMPTITRLIVLFVDVVVYYFVIKYLIITNDIPPEIYLQRSCCEFLECSYIGNPMPTHKWAQYRFTRQCIYCGASDEQSLEDGHWYVKKR